MYGSSDAAISSCMGLFTFEHHQIHQFVGNPPIPDTGINFGVLHGFIGCTAVSITQGNKIITVGLALPFHEVMR